MSNQRSSKTNVIEHQRAYQRFDLSQCVEHGLLLISVTMLLATGLPQKYREMAWSQTLLSTPERLQTFQWVHHFFALVLAGLAVYHFAKIIVAISKRKLTADMLITWQDIVDAFATLRYLLFLSKEKPSFGKFNFEQKVTYWLVLTGLLVMGFSGLIIWFPEWFTHFLPGGIVPAAKLTHSAEAAALAVFLLIWHIYHVHIERLNLSIFTGKLTEKEMMEYHRKEYDRVHRSKDQ